MSETAAIDQSSISPIPPIRSDPGRGGSRPMALLVLGSLLAVGGLGAAVRFVTLSDSIDHWYVADRNRCEIAVRSHNGEQMWTQADPFVVVDEGPGRLELGFFGGATYRSRGGIEVSMRSGGSSPDCVLAAIRTDRD